MPCFELHTTLLTHDTTLSFAEHHVWHMTLVCLYAKYVIAVVQSRERWTNDVAKNMFCLPNNGMNAHVGNDGPLDACASTTVLKPWSSNTNGNVAESTANSRHGGTIAITLISLFSCTGARPPSVPDSIPARRLRLRLRLAEKFQRISSGVDISMASPSIRGRHHRLNFHPEGLQNVCTVVVSGLTAAGNVVLAAFCFLRSAFVRT